MMVWKNLLISFRSEHCVKSNYGRKKIEQVPFLIICLFKPLTESDKMLKWWRQQRQGEEKYFTSLLPKVLFFCWEIFINNLPASYLWARTYTLYINKYMYCSVISFNSALIKFFYLEIDFSLSNSQWLTAAEKYILLI